MADFKKAFEKLKKLEYNKPENALHTNKGEDGYTFMGIYQKYHKESIIWSVLETYKRAESDIKMLSKLMYNNIDAKLEVERIYKNQYWDAIKGDHIKSQHIAEEMFIFGVNTHPKTAIKTAQRVVNVVVDGIIGAKTIKALNEYDEDIFSVIYDNMEKEHYQEIAESKPHLAHNLKGWENRAEAV